MDKSCRVRVAVVGCGQIADAHLQEIRYIPTAKLVAVCDQIPELADQASKRFGVPQVFTDVDHMIDVARPDVVHLTTPPHTHCSLACRILSAGRHVYVEKPFTVDLAETDEVLRSARVNERLVCVGHDQLFDPVWQMLMEQIGNGKLGEVVHVDSIMGYNLDGPFGKLMQSDRTHWLHKLPGGLFHNNISHAIYKITPFVHDESPRIWATTDVPEGDISPTELRVLIQGEAATATVLFSSRSRPVLRCLRIYGSKATVEVDFDGRLLHWYRGPGLPGALGKLHLPWQHLCEAARTLAVNSWEFLRYRQQYFLGMRRLFASFYAAIQSGGEPPIEYSEIRRVTAWMDRTFESCRTASFRSQMLTSPLTTAVRAFE